MAIGLFITMRDKVPATLRAEREEEEARRGRAN